MKTYELAYLISQGTSETELKDFVQEINSSIQAEGGVVLKPGSPELKNLAYPIKKQNSAFLISSEMNFFPDKLEDLKKRLRKENRILRFIIISKELPRKGPAKRIRIRKKPETDKKVELKEIEKKLEEILGE